MANDAAPRLSEVDPGQGALKDRLMATSKPEPENEGQNWETKIGENGVFLRLFGQSRVALRSFA